MTKISLPLFGDIDYQSGKANETFGDIDVFYASLDFDSRKIDIGLWINYDKVVDQSKFKNIRMFLDDLEEFDECAVETMRLDLESDESEYVKEFVDYHIEECGINPGTKLTELKLVRINFYPQEEEGDFAVFDYSYGVELSDQLLVMNFDNEGQINYLSWES